MWTSWRSPSPAIESVAVALVTGATGLVGSHIVDRLLAQGWSVRALTRSPRAARPSVPPDVDIREGDVLDARSFGSAAEGSDVVFHAAANIFARSWEDYRVTNIEGTRNAIEAAATARARLLHISSVAVYGPAARYEALRYGRKTDEGTVLQALPERAYYARSKRDSEAIVLAAHAAGRLWASAVRPDVIYGPRDRQFVPRAAQLLRRMPIPLLNGGRSIMAIVHAANVAQGAVLAATNDVAGGKAYNLANDFDVSVRRFFELAAQGLGRRPFFVPVPLWAARGAVRGIRATMRLLTGGRFSFVSNSSIDFIAEDNPFSSDLARRELGWAPAVHPDTGIPESFRWWKETRAASPSSSSRRP
jgi:2-alkyl-3-oxoalkanoate reductase